MSGHSKWANIKHRKARQDAARGKMWSKCSRAIIAAARSGGGDPATNLTLRYAIEEAKAANMPKDTIERAVKKGAGADADAVNYESIRYEGYGAEGVAIIVEALTDNRNRTAPEMRSIFSKFGGNLGATGCVGYLFEQKGVFTVDAAKTPGEDAIMELALECGAEDARLEDGLWTITTSAADYLNVKEAIDARNLPCESAEVTMIPENTIAVSIAGAGKILRLVDALEDNDDVQKVFTNADLPEEALAD